MTGSCRLHLQQIRVRFGACIAFRQVEEDPDYIAFYEHAHAHSDPRIPLPAVHSTTRSKAPETHLRVHLVALAHWPGWERLHKQLQSDP